MLALIQALLPHCDLSSPYLRPFLVLHPHEYPPEDRRAQPPLPWVEEGHQQEEVVGQHPSVASGEAEEVQSLVALEVVEEVRRCSALAVEEERHCWAWVGEEGSTFLALVVVVGLKM